MQTGKKKVTSYSTFANSKDEMTNETEIERGKKGKVITGTVPDARSDDVYLAWLSRYSIPNPAHLRDGVWITYWIRRVRRPSLTFSPVNPPSSSPHAAPLERHPIPCRAARRKKRDTHDSAGHLLLEALERGVFLETIFVISSSSTWKMMTGEISQPIPPFVGKRSSSGGGGVGCM